MQTSRADTNEKKHQHVLALLDLSLPVGSHHNGREIVEGIAKATLLLQVAQQSKTSLAYNILCSSKPEFNSSIASMKQLLGPTRVKQCEGFRLHACLHATLNRTPTGTETPSCLASHHMPFKTRVEPLSRCMHPAEYWLTWRSVLQSGMGRRSMRLRWQETLNPRSVSLPSWETRFPMPWRRTFLLMVRAEGVAPAIQYRQYTT